MAGPAEAQAIRYGFAIRELDGPLTTMSNVSWRLEETNGFVNDCDNPPCTSFNLKPAINNSVAEIDKILYAPKLLFRSEEYHDSIEFGHRTSYPMEYNTATSSCFSSLCFHEGTHNVMTMWKYDDESPSVTVSDSILMFIFGISCLINLFGSNTNTPQKKRRRESQKRKRKVRR
ncbi:MAG: hypothetical protein KAS07_05465 [Candidatus Pacebacteria bacterium]|nr:hypothetical protein [Candidatus Paceibacterota bacterium]